jgi:hypothetical protein
MKKPLITSISGFLIFKVTGFIFRSSSKALLYGLISVFTRLSENMEYLESEPKQTDSLVLTIRT